MFKLGALAAAATIAVGICSLSTDASARVGGGHMGGGGGAHFGGGGAHFRGGMANFGSGARFGGARFARNVGGWNGYRGGYRSYGDYGARRYGLGGFGLGVGLGAGYSAYASCYVWTPLGYVNQCGYDYSYYW